MELPPRARRIPRGFDSQLGRLGTTSACAENTPQVAYHLLFSRNYLRVRGEYKGSHTTQSFGTELPPRARRILWDKQLAPYINGTTSACAENTCGNLLHWSGGWNYLRVRGEYAVFNNFDDFDVELPPRARRIP